MVFIYNYLIDCDIEPCYCYNKEGELTHLLFTTFISDGTIKQQRQFKVTSDGGNAHIYYRGQEVFKNGVAPYLILDMLTTIKIKDYGKLGFDLS